MALPNAIDSTTPPGSQSPGLGDDRIREFKLGVVDIFGLPDGTNISQAGFDFDAGGLAQCIFYDPAVVPASGELGRNGSTLYYRITDARTNTTTRPFGIVADTTGSVAASIGVGMLFQAESADESPSDFGAVDFVASDITAGSEDTYASILLRVAGNAIDEKYRFSSTAGVGFSALLTHAVTADRTYTFADRDATLGARYSDITLTNSAAGSTAVGDVLAVSSQTAVLGDTQGSLQKFVVAQAVIANGSTGEFARSGVVSAVSTGTIAAMQYVRKSATTRAVEDALVAVGSGTPVPQEAIGFALAAASGGTVLMYLFDKQASTLFGTRTSVSRSVNTAYQESTTKVTIVTAEMDGSGSGISLTVLSDSSNPPTTQLGQDIGRAAAGTSRAMVTFPVMAGHYWRITAGDGSIANTYIYQ